MSFKITVRQKVGPGPIPDPHPFFRRTVGSTLHDPPTFFQTVEKTVHATSNGGAWSVANEQNVLIGDVNGTSGCLRFISDSGEESFIAAFGMDQEMPWCDIVPDLTPTDTALMIHPQYYAQPDRIAIRKAHKTSCTITNSSGRNLAINLTDTNGRHPKANLIIG